MLGREIVRHKPVKNHTAIPSAESCLTFQYIKMLGGLCGVKSELERCFHCKTMDRPCFYGALRPLEVLGHEEHDLD